MSSSYTIEIEDAHGEDIDTDRLARHLADIDIKVKTYAPGSHVLSRIGLAHAVESAISAIRLALPDGHHE